MHCSPKQQAKLAGMMVERIGGPLFSVRNALRVQPSPVFFEFGTPQCLIVESCCPLQFDDLVATGRAASLSPLDLRCRVLAKGKVIQEKKSTPQSMRKRLSSMASLKRLSSLSSLKRLSGSTSDAVAAAPLRAS
eukprot:5943675-Prymnesium_polylepis.1